MELKRISHPSYLTVINMISATGGTKMDDKDDVTVIMVQTE